MAHTDKQFAAGRKRAQAKASWSTPKTKKLPPLSDNGTHALVERDADGRFCPRRGK